MTIHELLVDAKNQLQAGGIVNAVQEAEWLLADILHRDRLFLHLERDWPVSPEQGARFAEGVRRLLAGEPLQYVMGSVEFYGLRLEVGPGVLIPRPETERLVELALEFYPGRGSICDLCTGSGAIALALAHELPPDTAVCAVDISPEALVYARRNKDALGLANVEFHLGDLFAPLPPSEVFSLITANPPYIAPELYCNLSPEVLDYEPRLALEADNAGLAIIERLAVESRRRLSPEGAVFAEISCEQGDRVREIFQARGYAEVKIHRDYADRDRIVEARGGGSI
jgi:release factor glutamine methyltransferase